MKINIQILILVMAITFGLSGCMMKNMFSDNDSSRSMGMMGAIDTNTNTFKEPS